MPDNHPFKGRALTVVSDLSVDEQRYLYQKTREFKTDWMAGKNLDAYRITNPELSIYLMFLENSTRTKESFRNAVNFHDVKLNIFDASSSSFIKSESLVDTVKMLFGYSRSSIFIMRTRMEGVCRALEEELRDYAEKSRREVPIFINAGDGRHEHPTQEFLDEFTFLEHQNWDFSSIHLALIGDLRHGRTIHSKTDGLRIFNSVTVDLVAPEELSLPGNYKRRMKDNGFEIREWPSIAEYLKSGEVSSSWYFTRLQLERMGDEIKDKEAALRQSVTFNRKWLAKLPASTRFYHPLPRHRKTPVIPSFLDRTPLNGWDSQSVNGYFTRVIELAMLAGQVGSDFNGQTIASRDNNSPFITRIKVTRKTHVKDRFKVGIKPVENGTVIDHISRDSPPREIWDRIDNIRRILNLDLRGSHGVFHTTGSSDSFKGIMSLPDVMEMKPYELKKLAAVSPNCTVNLIENHSVKAKYRLAMPPRIYKFSEISCKNPDCITWPEAYQHIPPYFYRSHDNTFTCKYCEKRHEYSDIWDI